MKIIKAYDNNHYQSLISDFNKDKNFSLIFEGYLETSFEEKGTGEFIKIELI